MTYNVFGGTLNPAQTKFAHTVCLSIGSYTQAGDVISVEGICETEWLK